MRILMRNTVFKTAALAGLFSCMLMLAGAFSGITASVHAVHEGFIHADEVGTDEDKLKEFVEDAVDAYYLEFLIRRCDFSSAPFASLITIDLLTVLVEEIKELIPSFSLVGLNNRSDLEPYCDFTQLFHQVFDKEGDRGEGDWKSGSIYLFVMDDQGRVLFDGADPSVEGEGLVAEDEGGRDVADEIITEVQDANEDGFVEYCWDDPTEDGDDIDDNDPKTAPGDSWKKSYVVDPFVYLKAPALSGSPRVIFGSGIYPKTDEAPPGCDGNGMADYDGDDMDGDGDDMDGDGDDMDGDGDDMDGDGDDMDGDGDDMDGDGDDMDGDGDDTPSVEDIADSGGCAIAAGSDSTPRGTAFNLLLIVSTLFFTISFRNRVAGRRNGIQS